MLHKCDFQPADNLVVTFSLVKHNILRILPYCLGYVKIIYCDAFRALHIICMTQMGNITNWDVNIPALGNITDE